MLISVSPWAKYVNKQYNLIKMKILAIIKSLIAQEATTMTKVCERLLCEKARDLTMNNLSRKLRMETVKYVEVEEIADLLGYDIKFVKRK